MLLANNNSSNEEEDEDVAMDTDDEKNKPQTSSLPNEGASTSCMPIASAIPTLSFLKVLCSSGADGQKENPIEMYVAYSNSKDINGIFSYAIIIHCFRELPTTPGGSFSSWAPEKFSILRQGQGEVRLKLMLN